MNPLNGCKLFLPFLVVPLLAGGCTKRVEQNLTKLEKGHVALQAKQLELSRAMEELSNSIMVIQDRVETLKVAVEQEARNKQQSAAAPLPRAAAKKPVAHRDEEAFMPDAYKTSALPAIRLTNKDLEKVKRPRDPPLLPK